MSTNERPVSQYMTPSPHTVGLQQSISTAAGMMLRYQVRHLPVLDGGELRGLLSERDIFVLESIPGVDREKVHVDEAMSPLTYAVAPSTPLHRVAREMAAHKYGAAVVMEGPRVVGVFTTVDACRALAELCEQP